MCVTALAPAVSGCQRYRPGCPCSRGGLLASVLRHVRPFRSFWPGWPVRFVRCGPFDFVAPFTSFSSPCSLESAVAQVWRTRRGDRPDTATDHVARGHEDSGQTWVLVLSGRGNLPGLNIRLEYALLAASGASGHGVIVRSGRFGETGGEAFEVVRLPRCVVFGVQQGRHVEHRPDAERVGGTGGEAVQPFLDRSAVLRRQ